MPNGLNDISDNILAARIRQNDKNAFKTLYDRYSRKIYFFSLKHLNNASEAEELVQSVFINVWENRRSLNPDNSVKSYIYKAAVNYIINYLRKKTIRAGYIESELNKSDKYSDITYEQVFFQDLESSINSIVGTLPAQQQKIFSLGRTGGLSHEEIARRMGLSIRTVENQMYRSVQLIRKILREKYYRD
jgi:RNA polymerase sigma-70 factor (ECF subfamily)